MKVLGNRAGFLNELRSRLGSLPEMLDGKRFEANALDKKTLRPGGLILQTLDDVMPRSSGTQDLLTAAAWVFGGLGVMTLGLLAGRELRGRYKFKRRTPYDYYSHSDDGNSGLDYSVGI